MTIMVKVSCNGNYKCPVSYKQGDREESFTLSGRGKSGPDERTIPFYHSADVMTLSVGPEEQDSGEAAEAAEMSGLRSHLRGGDARTLRRAIERRMAVQSRQFNPASMGKNEFRALRLAGLVGHSGWYLSGAECWWFDLAGGKRFLSAIAMEARQGGNAEERSHAKHDSAGLEEASPDTSSQTPAPKE